jgi:hypothetical protein
VKRLVAAIRERDREAAIIIFSDHGYRHDPMDRDESLRNLFMASTPGHPRLFPEDTTLVNVFPTLLNAYFDAGLPLADETSYWVDMSAVATRGVLALERVEP